MQRLPELGTLRAELRAAGLFEHRELASWLELLAYLVGTAACMVAIATWGWLTALWAVPVAAVLSTSAAMLGHEGSHRSFSASPWRNALLTYITFPLFTALSSLYWREKHDRLHHGHPNVEGKDPDIRPFPFVSSRGDHEQCGPRERWFQRHCQGWAFWPMSLLMSIGMRRSSILYVIRYPRRHGRTGAWWAEVACLLIHYTGWLVVPSLVWGPLAAIALYLAMWSLVGVFLSLIFAPAHIGLPVTRGQHHDWLHQVETTRDLQLPRVVSWFFIGLDYQVEHHLFPKIPHQHLPEAARLTAAWCQRHGVQHLSMPYLSALADSARFIATAWSRDASDPIEVRAGLVGGDHAHDHAA